MEPSHHDGSACPAHAVVVALHPYEIGVALDALTPAALACLLEVCDLGERSSGLVTHALRALDPRRGHDAAVLLSRPVTMSMSELTEALSFADATTSRRCASAATEALATWPAGLVRLAVVVTAEAWCVGSALIDRALAVVDAGDDIARTRSTGSVAGAGPDSPPRRSVPGSG